MNQQEWEAAMAEQEVDQEADVNEGGGKELTLVDKDLKVIKREETWLRQDWRHLVAAQKYCNSRDVGIAIMCAGCGQPLLPTGVKGDGATIVECGCTVRRWTR